MASTTPLPSGRERAEFDALVNLTCIIAGFQHESELHVPPPVADVEDDDEMVDSDDGSDAEDAPSIANPSIIANSSGSTEDADLLKRKFLDRLAEVASKCKGGNCKMAQHKRANHVVCTAMFLEESAVKLFVSCNQPFDSEYKRFFDEFTSLMQDVARDEGERESKATETLWTCISEHQSHRMETVYVPAVKECLRDLFKVDTLQSCCHDCEGSHPILLTFQEQLEEPLDTNHTIRCRQLAALAIEALQIRRSSEVRHCLKGHVSGSKIFRRLCFLARARVAFEYFVEAATTFPRFRNLEFVLISHSKDYSVKVRPLDLNEALGAIGPQIQPVLASLYDRGERSSLPPKTIRKFDELRKGPRHMHAEVQMIMHLAKEDLLGKTYLYLGCSKYACFLCWELIKALHVFEARGCHGKLYHKWMLPKSDSVPKQYQERFVQAFNSVQSQLLKTILGRKKRTAEAIPAESSSGMTTVMSRDAVSSHVEMAKKSWHEQSERLCLLREATKSIEEPMGYANNSYHLHLLRLIG
jgi:IS1 family transposase